MSSERRRPPCSASGRGHGRGQSRRPLPPTSSRSSGRGRAKMATLNDHYDETATLKEGDDDPGPIDWDKMRLSTRSNDPPSMELTPFEERSLTSIQGVGVCADEKITLKEIDAVKLENALKMFNECEHPVKCGLKVAAKCWDFKGGKNASNCNQILRLAEKFKNPKLDFEIEFQKGVFQAYSKQTNPDIMARAFKLAELEKINEIFIPEILKISAENFDYKKSAEISYALNLQPRFALNDFIVPLILENRTEFLESTYLDSHPGLPQQFVGFLDTLYVDNTRKISDLMQSHPNKKALNCKRLNQKPLGRFIEKMLDKFQLQGVSAAPNHFRIRKMGAFKHHVGTKDDPKMRRENWRDLMAEYIKDDPDLQYELVNYLIEGKFVDWDQDEAIYWVDKYNLQFEKLPWDLKRHLLETKNADSNQAGTTISWNNDEENWDDEVAGPDNASHYSDQFLPFSLNYEDIIFVDEGSKFSQFLDEIATADVKILGFDCEFRPHALTGGHDQVALLQMATRDKAYILDVTRLSSGKECDPKYWNILMENVFSNKDIIKLGFSFKGDFQVLSRTIPQFKEIDSKSHSVLEMDMLAKRLIGDTGCLNAPFETNLGGLSGLVESLQGKPLDKRDQISNWDKRPLSDNQLIYAAFDAKVLIDLFDTLEDLAVNKKAEEVFHAVVAEQIRFRNKLPPKSRKKNKEESQKDKQEKSQVISLVQEVKIRMHPVKALDLKLVLDSMLCGLSKKLRIYGVDCINIESFQGIDELGDLALKESRHVVTKGCQRHIRLKRLLGKSGLVCFGLSQDKPDDQIDEIFKFFNIIYDEDDLFARCSLCNNDNYIVIPQNVAKLLKSNLDRKSEANYRPDFDSSDSDEYEFAPPDEGARSVVNKWTRFEGGEICLDFGIVKKTAKVIKFGDVPFGVIDIQEQFFACDNCGKVYWEGSHWKRIKSK